MKRIYLLFFLCLFLTANAYSKVNVCTQKQAEKADAAIDSLTSWSKLNAFYNTYKQCDDGSISEGYSGAVAQLLTHHWKKLDGLAPLIKNDPSFEEFII